MSKKGSKVVAKKAVEVPSQCDTSHLEYTAMCSFYAIGKCLRGENCKFAHSALQIRQKPDLTRTSLCHDFMRKRSCKNGDNCRYAHGEKELQLRPQKASSPSPASPASPVSPASPASPSQIADPDRVDSAPLTWDPRAYRKALGQALQLPQLLQLACSLWCRSSWRSDSKNRGIRRRWLVPRGMQWMQWVQWGDFPFLQILHGQRVSTAWRWRTWKAGKAWRPFRRIWALFWILGRPVCAVRPDLLDLLVVYGIHLIVCHPIFEVYEWY